ncbi:MAG TPA: PRC-barrel domain-containing protein [Gaiellaceae bacterium]|jgi:sporulation protein YlmC with PRC-barrel domain|nr:PRC-barrel domain-containing protein [Gaiellaceae bacterium]
MGSFVCGDLLALPVRTQGIELGRSVEVVLDLEAGRVLGLEVRCGDGVDRFVPLVAARLHAGEITLASPLTLLDEVAFYRARGRTLGSLRGAEVTSTAGPLGSLRDVVFGAGGEVRELVVAAPSGELRVRPGADVCVAAPRASAA